MPDLILRYNEFLTKKDEYDSIYKKLHAVNLFFNYVCKYKREIKDYWKTPEEFLTDGFGDCEDFAIAKFYTFIKFDFDKQKLKFAYCHLLHKNGTREAHMVLLYYHSDSLTVVLDNHRKTLKALNKRVDLDIVYTFNEDSIFFNDDILNNTLSKWSDMNDRIA